MDLSTHFLVPYAGALLVLGAWRQQAPRHRIAWALAFGIGGCAPDADTVVAWVARLWPTFYFLQHRGLSHSLIGAPLFAFAVMAAVAPLAARWRRAAILAWAPGVVVAAMLGSLTHLALDGVTYGGIPLWWPFASGRVMWPVFSWIVWWLFPIGALVVGLFAWGKIDRRAMAACGVAFVVILAGLGAWRLAARPDAPEGGLVYPRTSIDEWMVFTPQEDAWVAELVRGGAVVNRTIYRNDAPTEAAAAIAAARDTDEYRGYLMGLFGPEVVHANAWEGGWNVSFEAVAHRFDGMNRPRWTPAHDHGQWGLMQFHVGEQVTTVSRGW